jgi:GT2 family glycosyltransferase
VEILRRRATGAVVVFLRFYDRDHQLSSALPYRADERVTRFFWLLDPEGSVEVVSGDDGARVRVTIRSCRAKLGLRQRVSRAFERRFQHHNAARLTEAPSRIIPWSAQSVADPSEAFVSFIIPTRDRADLLARAVDTLFLQARWKKKELIIVDNGSVEPATFALFDKLRQVDGINILRVDEPFNFSRLINAGAAQARGNVFALLNNDLECENSDWLLPLVGLALDPRVGVVGVKLLHENRTVQHACIALGIRGLTAHIGAGHDADDPGPHDILTTTRRVSAVTGACMLTRREVFERAGGFDERFVIEFNDVDYCLRIDGLGLATVYAANPTLIHKESSTRQARPLRDQELLDRCRFVEQWGRKLVDDPYYPQDLTLSDESLSPRWPEEGGADTTETKGR